MLTMLLHNVSCDPHTVDKEPYITDTRTVAGTVRGDLYMQRPTFEITGDASAYNYIAVAGRYYQIISCDRKRTGLSVLQCQLDPLWTYRDAIYQLSAVADRSYRLVNSYLPDDQQRVYQYTQCVNKIVGTPSVIDGQHMHYSASSHILLTVG